MLEKKQKQVENLRKRALNSDIMQDLRDQYYDGPQEIKVDFWLTKCRLATRLKHVVHVCLLILEKHCKF